MIEPDAAARRYGGYSGRTTGLGIQDFQDELLAKNNDAKLTDEQLLQAMRDEFPTAKGQIFTADLQTRLKRLDEMRRLFNRRTHDNQAIVPPRGGVNRWDKYGHVILK